MLLTFLALTPALLLGPFVALVFIVTVAAFFFRNVKRGTANSKFLVLIPAHNEESSIERTLKGLSELAYPKDQFTVMVIADNCTDKTATLAKDAGALVYERTNIKERGKGHALAEVTSKVVQGDIEGISDVTAIVMIDADTLVDKSILTVFDQGIANGFDWMQGYYNGSNPNESLRTGLMSLALGLFNGVWNQGMDALGLSVPLRGNGMCMTVAGLKRHPWKAFGLAEDLEFAWSLRLAGEKVHFLPEAKVYGELVANNAKAEESQRLRWEHGRKVLRKIFSFMLRRAKLPVPQKTAYFLDLYMLPITTLAVYVVMGGAFGVLLSDAPLVQGIYGLEIGIILLYLASPAVLGFVSWSSYGYLVRLPQFILWKLILWFKKKPEAWVRTARSKEVSR